jgi:tetratricopeptide (TPR) repeat protein
MKNKKHELRKSAPSAVVTAARPDSRWPVYTALAAALIAVWWAYSPALHGPFLFDDNVLPFALPGANATFTVWTAGVRPVTMLTYWINARLSGEDPFSYHVLSVVLHCITSGLVFLIVRRLLSWSNAPQPRRTLLAAFAASVYLLHPAQAEAIAYLAGRAEAVSVMFVYAAFTVFLYRREAAASWGTVAVVLVLFGAALLSKEHTIVLPALLLLTDYWWNPGFSFKGIRGNWKLYTPMALGAVAGVAAFWTLLTSATTAGFGMKDLTWYQYLFTQFRALFVYIGIFVLPVNLTADWDFAFSRTLFDRGAIVGLLVLLALIAVAWRYRRRFPLASYGFFVFLLLMAPTSSVLPIRDPIAERRLYFSMLGLLLIVVDLLARVRFEKRVLAGACAAVVLLLAIGAHARAEVWSNPVSLWEDTVRKSPGKSRARLQLAQSYYDDGQYQRALDEYEQASRLQKPDYNMLVNWGLAYQRLNQLDQALAKLQQAAALEQTAHVYSQIGMIYVQRMQQPQALQALATAEKLDPSWAATYNYRAKLYFQLNDLAPAIANYRRALALNPRLSDARDELMRAEAMLRAAGGR